LGQIRFRSQLGTALVPATNHSHLPEIISNNSEWCIYRNVGAIYVELPRRVLYVRHFSFTDSSTLPR
jgi:hypothetical protein